MRIVVALGGNALLERGQVPDAEAQVANIRRAMAALAPLVDEHDVVITHGNGPQVGVLAMESAADPRLTEPYPFDALGAMTEGLIGSGSCRRCSLRRGESLLRRARCTTIGWVRSSRSCATPRRWTWRCR